MKLKKSCLQKADKEKIFFLIYGSICSFYSFNSSFFQCPIDTRRMLAENLVIIGGTASMLGLRHRLLAEIRTLAASEAFSKVVKISSFKIHNPPAKANYVAWLGGKALGGWLRERGSG